MRTPPRSPTQRKQIQKQRVNKRILDRVAADARYAHERVRVERHARAERKRRDAAKHAAKLAKAQAQAQAPPKAPKAPRHPSPEKKRPPLPLLPEAPATRPAARLATPPAPSVQTLPGPPPAPNAVPRLPGESQRAADARAINNPHSIGGIYSIENMVPRERHPANTMRKRLGLSLSGIAGKLYCKWSRLDLVIDDLRRLYASIGWCAAPVEADPLTAHGPAVVSHAAAPETTGPTCKACKRSDFTKTRDGDALVCAHCGVVGDSIRLSLHREKACTEDEDKTQRAEKPRNETDRFAEPAMSVEQARRTRENAAMGAFISKKTKARLQLGWLQEKISREVARAQRVRDGMTAAEQTREAQILQQLEGLFSYVEPVCGSLKKHCRRNAWRIWQAAVQHAGVCAAHGQSCQIDIRSRTPGSIAEAVLQCSMKRLLHGDDDFCDATVSKSALIAINGKLNARRATQSGGQLTVSEQVARIFDELADAPEEVVDYVVPPCCSPRAKTTPVPAIKRNASDLAAVADSFVLNLRDAINLIFSLLIAPQTAVKRAAIAALNDARFRAHVKSSQLNVKALALVVLQAVALELEQRATASPSPGGAAGASSSAPLPASKTRLVASLGVTCSEVAEHAAAVRAHLAPSLFATRDDEDLL